MKETTLGISEFKARCLSLIEEVAATGSVIVVTKRGRPLARVEPVSPPKRALRGSWKRLVRIKGDIVRFDTSDLWESGR